MINFEQWEGFEGRIWKEEVNVRDFIQKNYIAFHIACFGQCMAESCNAASIL